ncbi:MAG TPA: TolC family protein [Polyangiaceae bacterium]|nr:TolC family protein [Polyangiaceae bacterium]
MTVLDRKLLAVAGVVSAAVTASNAARSDEAYRVPDALTRQAQLPDSMQSGPTLALSMSEAIQLAVRQNLGIVLSREQYVAAQRQIDVQWGKSFEPVLRGSYSASSATTPPQLTLLQNGDQALSLNTQGGNWFFGISQTLETATQLSLGYSSMRQLTRPGQSVPLVYNAGLNFTLTQPLLKNFAFDLAVPRQDVLRARFDSDRAKQDARTALIAAVKSTDDAYWDVVLALKSYAIGQDSLKLADEQLALTQRQIDAGILAPSDLITVESTQAQRAYTLLQAESQIGTASDTLRTVLNLPRDDWRRPLLPVDPPQFVERSLDLDTSYQIALGNRPEVAQARIDVEKAALNVRVAKTDRLPELDFVFNYGLAGQGVTYGETVNQVFGTNLPAVTATLNLAWTPLMKGSEANVDSLRATENAKHTQLDVVRVNLYAELRNDLRALDFAARQVHAAAKFRDLAQQALDAEQRKFLNGNNMSNNILVALKQDQLAQAQLAELQAIVAHHKASTAIDAAMGVLLDQRGIDLRTGG